MTTLWTYRLLAGFGNADSAEVGDFVEFGIQWDGGLSSMPGWDQGTQSSEYHVPGSNTNVIFLLGYGAITRSFTVLCPSRKVYADLAALQQYQGTLRVPAAMNELDIATEVDYSGTLVADIPDVILMDLTGTQVYVDGSVSALARFWRGSRT